MTLNVVVNVVHFRREKGPNNICIYQGGITPESISEKLRDVKYSDAVACGEDGNFYLCMKNPKGE